MAAFTLDKGFAFFDPGHRDKKYLKIMIDALVIGLVQSADRTAPGIFVKHLRFRGYAEDKEHFRVQRFRVQRFKVFAFGATCIITPKPLFMQIRTVCRPARASQNSNDTSWLIEKTGGLSCPRRAGKQILYSPSTSLRTVSPSAKLRTVSPSAKLRTVSLSNGLSNHRLRGNDEGWVK